MTNAIPSKNPSTQSHYHSKNIFLFLFVLCILPFSPILAYIGAFAILFLGGVYLNKIDSRLIFLGGVFAHLYIMVSKTFLIELQYDLSYYWYRYVELSQVNSFAITDAEPGWYWVYYIVGKFFPDVTAIGIGTLNAALSLFLFCLWLFYYGESIIKVRNRALLYAMTLLFLWIPDFHFFQRQSLSVVILLFAIANLNNKKFYPLLLLSSVFHLTALFLGVIYKFVLPKKQKSLYYWLSFFCVLLFVRFFFFHLVAYLLTFVDFFDLGRKLFFYTQAQGFFVASSQLRLLPLFVFLIIAHKKIPAHLRAIVLFTVFFYLAFFGVQFLPSRVAFIFDFLYGYLLFVCWQGKSKKIIYLFVLAYFLFDLLIKTNFLLAGHDPYWQRYPMFSFEPFYYLF